MILLRALVTILLVLVPVYSAGFPLEDMEDFTSSSRLTEYVVLTHRNCSNITRDEMGVVLSYYPHVKVKCQAESSVLIPATLDIPENVDGKNRGDNPGLLLRWNEFELNEFVLVLRSESTRHMVPLAPCCRTLGMGRGIYEFSFSISGLLTSLKEVARAIPFYTFLGGHKLSLDLNSEVIYNLICAYDVHQVRPVAEVSTMITKEKIRTWIVNLTKKNFVKKSKWEELDRALVMEDTLLMSCVSERHVANICSWNNDEVIANLKVKTLKEVANDRH